MLVAGIATEIPITLDDKLIPTKVPLFVDVPPRTESEPKMEGRDATPRTPSHADIENAPETYSTDLGTGHCVQFNKPNRAIEEFDFYTVVRTTEPGIVGFTAAGDPMAGAARPDGALATIVPTAAAAATTAAAAEVARFTSIAAVIEASQAAAAAVKAGELSTASGIAAGDTLIADIFKSLFRKLLTSSRADITLARDTTTTYLEAQGVSTSAAQEVAKALTDAAVAAVAAAEAKAAAAGTVLSPEFSVLVTETYVAEFLNSAAATAAEAARSAQSAATVATARAATAHTAATASVKAAEAAEAAKAAEIAARAQALEAGARAQLEARSARNKPPEREVLNKGNPIDWDETPTFYQAAEIAHGHLLHFKQVWYADGYSLGDLLYSLPLAPGQKKLISVVDWERRERTERTEGTFSSEALNAAVSRDRDLGEVVTGALTESSRGGSKSTSVGVGAGTGAAGNGSYQAFNFGALIGVSGGYGESNSSAWQASARNLSSSSLQTLRDRTLQSASAVRSLRSSVVHTVSQGEAVRATTEVVANHNHCHAVTIQYFEVLRHLKLQHELADVQECLFVPLPMSEFDLAKALRWRQSLQTYLQRRELAGGFDAARRVQTNWRQVDSPLDRYADESIRSITGELLLTVMIPMPPFPVRPPPKPPDPADTGKEILNAAIPTEGAWGVLLAIGTGGASLIAAKTSEAVINVNKAAAKGVRGLIDDFYSQPTPQERYDKFHAEIMPGVVEAFVDQLELWALVGATPVLVKGTDFTLVSTYQPGIPLMVALRGTLTGQISRGDISQLIIKSSVGVPTGCKAIVNSATIRYRTASFEHAFVEDNRVNDDIDPPKVTGIFSAAGDFSVKPITLGTGATLYTPLDSWEQRNPRKDDERLATELVEHLNDNFEYYHHAIWWAMDPNRRYMLLDGYFAPNSKNRSVASVVENRLIGIVGNSLVLPVAHGVDLSPRVALDATGKPADLLKLYKLDTPVAPAHVSLPTRGVFAEAVMGSCNSCEEIDDSKFWRWEESPIDEPPSIGPISTATRRAEPASVLPSPFPTPIISIQNAPSAPDPAGVRFALDALGKQSFPDITGLAGTQANAAAAYQQALDTAFKFGKEASTLAQQAAMLKSLDKTMGAIDKAEAGDKIDSAKAKDLRTAALGKLVGDSGNAGADAADIQKRLDIISGAVKGDSISPDDGQGHSNAVLKKLHGDSASSDGASAIGEIIKRVTPEGASRVKASTPDGSSIEVEQGPAQAPGSVPRMNPNTLGATDLMRYLREQGLMNTHRWDLSHAWYVVIDADFHTMEVVSNATAGRSIDDVIAAHPRATAIINGTFFSGDLEMQSEGYLRNAGVELDTSLPADASGLVLPDEQRLADLIDTANKPKYQWVGTTDGRHLLFGTGHPPPASVPTAMGRLLSSWDLTIQNYTGVSVIAYNPQEKAILLLSREALTQGSFTSRDFERRARASGFTQIAYLDGGSSTALYVRGGGVLVRGSRHKQPPSATDTVTSYLVFQQ